MAEIFNWENYSLIFTPSKDQQELEEIGYDFGGGTFIPWNVTPVNLAPSWDNTNGTSVFVILPVNYTFSSIENIDSVFPGFTFEISEIDSNFKKVKYSGHIDDSLFNIEDYCMGKFNADLNTSFTSLDSEAKDMKNSSENCITENDAFKLPDNLR